MHELRFNVTLRCDSEEAIDRLERLLSIQSLASLTLAHPLFKLVDDLARSGDMGGFEVKVDVERTVDPWGRR